MVRDEVSFTSLCYIKEDHDGRKWLQRLADIDNGKLCSPFISNRSDFMFENRDRLFLDPDGPSEIGKVGIWTWTASPARDNPEIDYIQSYFEQDISPVRIVSVSAVQSMENLIEQLKNGAVRTQPYFCDTLFCYQPQRGCLEGVLCRTNEFQIIEKSASLKKDICSLPYYSIHTKDIFNWDDKNLRFLKALQMGEPSGFVSIGDISEVIRTIILERSTWPLFKECIGATKAEWRNSKKLLEKICDDSLYETVVQKLKCTTEQAEQYVNDFIERAYSLLDAGDIDADVLAQIALHHDKLRSQCEEAVSKKWEEAHAVDIATAKQELADVEMAVSSAEKRKNDLLEEAATAQSKCDQLLEKIEQYESLGKNVSVAVRQKIADVQNDMAGFIADISALLPQMSMALSNDDHSSLWKYIAPTEGLYSDDDIELAENWQNEFDAIYQNLSCALSVEPEFCTMLTAFLYATHINNVPILVLGPGGQDIAEVLSVSMYAKGVGLLNLGDRCDLTAANMISEADEPIVSIRNMFGKGWTDTLPQEFVKIKKQLIWTHPYVEDMIIEPKGLYNYMLPVLSEGFIGTLTDSKLWPSKRIAEFQPYISKEVQPLRISAFKRLGISKLLLNELTHILSDAKAILDNPAKEKDMEMLFGILPLCVLTERLDVLKEVIESESGISSSVEAETVRYIGEE